MQNNQETTDIPRLVRRAQSGDTGAFNQLAERFRSFAAAFTLGRVSDPGLAQDAVQEAFLETWICLHRLQHPAAFPAFLRRILIKRCDRLTRGKQTTNVPLETVTERAGENADLAETVEANRQRRVVRAALAALSPQDRTALLLHYTEGVSQEEVAAFLGLTVPTVKSRLHRARHRLRQEISQMEETLRELLTTFQDQVHRYATADGQTPDPQLLERARRKFEQQIEGCGPNSPLDVSAVHLGVSLLKQMRDPTATVALLERYLQKETLTPDEALWARWHLTGALSECKRHEDAVEAHKQMHTLFTRHGNAPRLCRHPWFMPKADPVMTAEEVALWVLMPMSGLSSVPESWSAQGVASEWQTWAEATLSQVPETEASRSLRFEVRQTMSQLAVQAAPTEPVGSLVKRNIALFERFRREAQAEGDGRGASRWEIDRECSRLSQAQLAQDTPKTQAIGEQIAALVADQPPDSPLRRIAGRALIYADLFDLAFLVMRPYADSSWLDWILKTEYAVCLWKVTGDVPAAAALLQEAQADRRGRGGQPDVGTLPVCKRNGIDALPAFVTALQ